MVLPGAGLLVNDRRYGKQLIRVRWVAGDGRRTTVYIENSACWYTPNGYVKDYHTNKTPSP